MKFGVTLLADDLGKLAERARLAEQIGFDYIGVADSQSLFRELYVSLTVVAQVTSRARIGTAVTNPLTRHPAVTSSAIASIDELSHGRAGSPWLGHRTSAGKRLWTYRGPVSMYCWLPR